MCNFAFSYLLLPPDAKVSLKRPTFGFYVLFILSPRGFKWLDSTGSNNHKITLLLTLISHTDLSLDKGLWNSKANSIWKQSISLTSKVWRPETGNVGTRNFKPPALAGHIPQNLTKILLWLQRALGQIWPLYNCTQTTGKMRLHPVIFHLQRPLQSPGRHYC